MTDFIKRRGPVNDQKELDLEIKEKKAEERAAEKAALKEFLDDYDWKEAFGEGIAEIDAPRAVIAHKDVSVKGISRDAVKRIIRMENGEGDESSWTGVFELKDGRFISVCSWCDYSGWGCQDGGEIFVAKTEEAIVKYGLSEHERKRLGYE